MKNKQYYGFEIELNGVSTDNMRKYINDAGLGRFFIVTYEHQCGISCEIKTKRKFMLSKKNLILFKKLFEVINDNHLMVSDSCGLHFHVDCVYKKWKDIKNILYRYYNLRNKYLDLFNPKKRSYTTRIFRREQIYHLNANLHKKFNHALHGHTNEIDVHRLKKFNKKRTVEFRLFDATTNFRVFLIYLKWLDRTVCGNDKKFNVLDNRFNNIQSTEFSLLKRKNKSVLCF